MPTRRARRRGLRWVAAAAALTALTLTGCTADRTAPASPGTGSSVVQVPVAVPATSAASPTSGTRASSTTPQTNTTSATRTPGTTTPGTTTPGTTTRPTTAGTCVAGHCYRIGPTHLLPDGVAPESSGIAASATPGVFFVVDDGTGTRNLEAVRSDGSLVASIPVAGMSARNAEALSAGPCGSRPGRCLYVADIGDNNARRASITIYRLGEPSLSPPPGAPLAADTWRYTYPDGPHNAEALVVAADGSLLVLTKSAPEPATGTVGTHRIYRAPAGGGVLRFVSTYRPPQPATPLQSLFTGTVVTDASYSAGRLLLLTYDQVIEYRAPTPGADPAGFPSWPHAELPAPAMIQSEGITADRTGCGYQVTSEEGPDGTRAALAGVECD